MVIKFSENGHPVFRSTSPLPRGTLKSKGGGKLSIHFCADEGTIETVFRTIISVNQLSICGAVSDLCEECNTCHDRTRRLVVAGQSNPLFLPSVMKTHIPLTDDPAQEEDLLQRYQERILKLSQQDRVIKILPCKNRETCFVPKSSLMKTPTPSTEDPAQEDLLNKVPRTSGKALTTKSCD